MFGRKLVAITGLAFLLGACGGGGGAGEGAVDPSKLSGKKTASGVAVSKAAKASFDGAMQQFVAHDKAGDWSEATCKAVAEGFLKAAKEQQDEVGKPFPEAIYNSGLSYQRCGMDNEALAQFDAALKAETGFHRARAQIALYDFKKGKASLDSTISNLETIIRDAKFQNAEALVSLAALQMQRDNDVSDRDGKNDLERAKKNIQRALAIDDSFMPAFNQLAIYYLELARKSSGEKDKGPKKRGSLVVSGAEGVDINTQQLDLAALVASQAVQKNPVYAPIHNTSGLIMVELKNYNGAVKSFKRARDLDPDFWEAHMNYGAVNLGFRGFGEAEKAYREALKLEPDNYEAHLGLALAIRGQIDMSNAAKLVPEAQKHLDAAKKLEPGRPETYYNEAILTQEFKAKGEEEKAIPALEKAADIYEDFVRKAGSGPEYAEAVKRSKERVQDIRDTVKFIKEGQQLRAQEAAAAKSAKPPAKK